MLLLALLEELASRTVQRGKETNETSCCCHCCLPLLAACLSLYL